MRWFDNFVLYKKKQPAETCPLGRGVSVGLVSDFSGEVADGIGVEDTLNNLDAFPERLDCVSFENRDGFLGQNRPLVEFFGGHMDCRAGQLDAVREGITDSVFALEHWEEGRVAVQDLILEEIEDPLVKDCHESCHGNDLNVIAEQSFCNLLRKLFPAEGVVITAEAVFFPSDYFRGDASFLSDFDTPALPVSQDEGDRQTVLDHGFEEGTGSGDEHCKTFHDDLTVIEEHSGRTEYAESKHPLKKLVNHLLNLLT